MPRRAQEGLWLLPWVKRGPGRLSDRGGTKDPSGFWGERSEKQDRNWGEASEAPGDGGGQNLRQTLTSGCSVPRRLAQPRPRNEGPFRPSGKASRSDTDCPVQKALLPQPRVGVGVGG